MTDSPTVSQRLSSLFVTSRYRGYYIGIFLVPCMLTVSGFEFTVRSDPRVALAIGAVSVTASFVASIIYSTILVRTRFATSLPATAGNWVVTGLTLGGIRVGVAVALEESPAVASRLVSSVFCAATCMALVAYTGSVVVEWLSLRADLKRAIELRDAASRDPQARQRMLWISARHAMSSELLPRLNDIQYRLAAVRQHPSPRALQRLSDHIGDVSQRVVRAMSHRVLTVGGLWVDAPDRRVASVRGLVRLPLVIPVTATLILSLTAVLEYWRIASGEGRYITFLALVVAVILVLAATTWWSRARRADAVAVRYWIALIIMFMAVIGPLLYAAALGGLLDVGVDAPAPLDTPLYLYLPFVGLTLTTIVVALVVPVQTTVIRAHAAQLTTELSAIEHDDDRHQRELWRRLALFLHGPVQGRLEAVRVMLDRRHRRSLTTERLDVIQFELAKTVYEAHTYLSLLTRPAEGRLLAASLQRLTQEWADVIGVTWAIRDRRGVGVTPSMLDLLEDLFTDMIVNALRHGMAHTARIELDIAPDRIEVVCEDDGTSLRSRSGTWIECSGLVAKLITAQGGRWAVMATDHGAVSTAVLPVDAHAAHDNVR